MEENFWQKNLNKPTRYFFFGDREKAQGLIADAKNILFQLKNIQSNGAPLFQLNKKLVDGSFIQVNTSVPGMDVVRITAISKKEKKMEEKENTRKYIAPVFLCYSWLPQSGKLYYQYVPEMFAIMPDFKNIAFVYPPDKPEEISEKMAQTYGEGYNYGYVHGNADKDITIVEVNKKTTIKIRELWNHYSIDDVSHVPVSFTPATGHTVNTGIPQEGTKHFSSAGDGYLYQYDAKVGPYVGSTEDVLWKLSYYLLTHAKNSLTYKILWETMRLNWETSVNYQVERLIFYWQGNPVFLYGFYPHVFHHTSPEDNVGFNDKVWYYLIYQGNIIQSKIGYEKIGNIDYPHLLVGENGKGVEYKGQTYYNSGRMRLVEIEEEITETITS